MKEIQHFKVKILPIRPQPNSVYFVVEDGATAVKTYVTDKCGAALPLIDLQGLSTLTGTGVTGTAENPIVNISTFVSSESGNLITLSTVDGKLFIESTQDNKIIYFYPTLEELGVSTLEEVTETHIANWIQDEGIIIEEDQIPFFKVQLVLYPIYFDITNRPNEFGGWPPLEVLELVKFYSTKDYTTQNAIGSTIYTDKSGNTIFVGDGNNYRFDLSPICSYGINSLGKIVDIECLYE